VQDLGRFAEGLQGIEAAGADDLGSSEDLRVLELVGAASGKLTGKGLESRTGFRG